MYCDATGFDGGNIAGKLPANGVATTGYDNAGNYYTGHYHTRYYYSRHHTTGYNTRTTTAYDGEDSSREFHWSS